MFIGLLLAMLQGDGSAAQVISIGSGVLLIGNTVLLATIVFKAGGLVEKISSHERRLEKLEDLPRGCGAEDCPLRANT